MGGLHRLLTISVLTFSLFYLPQSRGETIDPSTLIEVTADNDPSCVEYYNYKNTLYCSTTAQDTKPLDPALKDAEKLDITFDDRPWKLAWGKKDSRGTTIEYVPAGDNINNWNELVTSQFFPGMQDDIELQKYANGFIDELKASGYKPIVSFHEKTPERVIFEFRLEEPDNQIQDELQMVTKDDKGIYVLHYVIKKSDMGEENRNLWIENLKNSSIKDES